MNIEKAKERTAKRYTHFTYRFNDHKFTAVILSYDHEIVVQIKLLVFLISHQLDEILFRLCLVEISE